jgi:hypothetical protein
MGLKSGNLPWHQLQAGFIAAWFSRWAGKDIRACATDWSVQPKQNSDGASSSIQENYTRFIVGVTSKIQRVEPWVKQGMRTKEILEKLTANS